MAGPAGLQKTGWKVRFYTEWINWAAAVPLPPQCVRSLQGVQEDRGRCTWCLRCIASPYRAGFTRIGISPGTTVRMIGPAKEKP